MDKKFKIELSHKTNYGYGAYCSGIDLFDYLYIENLTNQTFLGLKISVKATHEAIVGGEGVVGFVAPFGFSTLSTDFVQIDSCALKELKFVSDVGLLVTVSTTDGEILAQTDFSVRLLPFDYFSGLFDMPETLSFFVTPNQKELSEIEVVNKSTDVIDFCHQTYDYIKSRNIKFSSQTYVATHPTQIRLVERVLNENCANALELALLFCSACERAGFSPMIAFLGKGKVFAGVKSGETRLNLLTVLERGNKAFQNLHFIDANYFAYGSELNFDLALYHSMNNLSMTDERITVLDIARARKLNLRALPDRTFESFTPVLSDAQWEEKGSGFSDYYSLVQKYSGNSLISSILTGNKIKASGNKVPCPFRFELDVNQNKILSKILSNEFTLIRAGTGTGVSTLFSSAAASELKLGRRVLYITDGRYHCDGFSSAASKYFNSEFVLDLTKEMTSFSKSKFEGHFAEYNDTFDNRNAIKDALERMDSYYSRLEGDKHIVSSFLVAADRYHQLRNANDSIVFSPEQIGSLSDETVQKWFELVGELAKSFLDNGSIADHPLNLIRQKNFSYEFKSRLICLLEDLLHIINHIISVLDQILIYFPSLPTARSFGGFFAFQDLIRVFSEFTSIPDTFFEVPENVEEHFRNVTKLIQAKKENDSIRDMILISFDADIFELDATDLHERFLNLENDKGLKAISQKYAILKSVKRYLKPNCDVENVEYILSRLYVYQKNSDYIAKEKERVFRLLSVPYSDHEVAWDKLQTSADLCYQAYTIFQNNFSLENLSQFANDFRSAAGIIGITEKMVSLHELVEEYITLKADFEKTIGNQIEFFYSQACVKGQDYFSFIQEKLSSVFSFSDRLKNWCSWLSVRDEAQRIGLKNIVSAIENGRVQAEELKKAFLRAFFKAICEYNFISYPDLIPEKFDIETCAAACKHALKRDGENSKIELDTILTMRRYNGLADVSSEVVDQLALLNQQKDSLMNIFPCLICDIKQATNLFSNDEKIFDLILIESRNKLSLHDFLWALSAGKKVAFAGNLSFSAKHQSDEFSLSAPAFDYLWKICEEKYSLSAVYSASPILASLRKNYGQAIRSDFRAYSVPAVSWERHVNHERVFGSYNNEYPGANFAEAERCLQIIFDHLSGSERLTLGIVTLTEEQKNLVLRLVAQKIRQSEDWANLKGRFQYLHIFSIYDNLVFCDRLVFSLTVAPDRSLHGSKLPFAFFEFGGKDPHKLLYQVVSSAGKEFTLLSSFSLEDLRYSPSVLPAVPALSLLFRCVSAPNVNCTYSAEGTYDYGSVIREIGQTLMQEGYSVFYGIQSGRYYIDLAVQNDDGKFVLGIVSDETVINQKSNISAIEIKNLSTYEQEGWKIFRLRSPFAFDSFDQQMSRIREILSPNHSEIRII